MKGILIILGATFGVVLFEIILSLISLSILYMCDVEIGVQQIHGAILISVWITLLIVIVYWFKELLK